MRLMRCFYCGDNTQELHRDHVRPISMDSVDRTYDKRDIVPCCRECNSTLSSRPITTLEERAAYLVERYMSKYRSVLATPRWSEEELEEMGRHMRSKIMANQSMKEYVKARIDTLNETAASMYDDGEIKHLRGVVTIDKKNAYRLISMFVSSDETNKAFVEGAAERMGIDEKSVVRIIDERDHFDVATTYKFERGFPLDYSLKAIKRSIRTP